MLAWDFIWFGGQEEPGNNTNVDDNCVVYVATSKEDVLAAREKIYGEIRDNPERPYDPDEVYLCCRERSSGELVGVIRFYYRSDNSGGIPQRRWGRGLDANGEKTKEEVSPKSLSTVDRIQILLTAIPGSTAPLESTLLLDGIDHVNTRRQRQQMITQAMRLTESTHFALLLNISELADTKPNGTKQSGCKFLSWYNIKIGEYPFVAVTGTDLKVAADVMRTRALNRGLHRLPLVDDGMTAKLTYCGLSVLNLIRTVLPATAWPNLVWPVARHEDHLASVLQLLKETTSKSAPTLAPVVARQLSTGLQLVGYLVAESFDKEKAQSMIDQILDIING